ncbi:MAG: APC family permease [Thermomicrobiales bacterium]
MPSSRYRPPRRPVDPNDDVPNGDDGAAYYANDLTTDDAADDPPPASPSRPTAYLPSGEPVSPDSGKREKRDKDKRVRAPRRHGPRAQGDLVGKEGMQGRLPGDRYVRVHRVQTDDFQRSAPGHLIATEEALEARGAAGRAFGRVKRTLIGAPLTTAAAAHERLTKVKALAVLSSDALSSVAYATEEILQVLLLAGLGALSLSLPIGAAIVALLLIVGVSYRQTIKAYPNGGGSYIVAIDNLGVIPALTAGSALLFGYVVTVAVSISAGVAALSSAVPSLRDHRVLLGLGFIVLVSVLNLRGIRESGSIFAVPTYLFLVGIMIMIAIGMVQAASHGFVPQPPVLGPDEMTHATSAVGILLILTAFSRGCAALTGVEAISDGVPAFKPPEWKNARATLTWMIAILAVTFAGITFLANQFGIVPKEQDSAGGYETVVSQIARTIFGGSTIPYYYIQFATLAILILAANTAYSDFPRLAYFLARDRFLPKQYTFRGDRLAYSRGIITLGALASLMLICFNAETTRMIPLYAVGVFTAFTLSQGGMVMRWLRLREPGWRMGLAINIVGVITTGLVAIVVGFTNFTRGAWVVLVLIPLLIMVFRAINRHYASAAGELAAQTPLKPEDIEHTVIVPISAINRVARQTLAYARSISPNVTAVFITDDEAEIEEMRTNWERLNSEVPLVIIESPYRSIVAPLLSYLDEIERQRPEDTITVVLPEFIARHWWEQFLHNQTALRIKASLLFRPGIVVTSVPYHLERRPPPSAAREEAA